MKKECAECPFKRCNEWRNGGIFWKMRAIEKMIDNKDVFSCHRRNPNSNIFSSARMVVNDCIGFKKLNVNIETPNTYPEIVNSVLETNPQGVRWDLITD